MRSLRSAFGLIAGYYRANLQAALEYRTSFASEVFSMLLNDTIWLVFWVAFYQRFPAVSGWGQAQIATLWAACTTGFGLAMTTFGSACWLAGMIARGELDFFLSLPRPLLLHALVSRMWLSAWGDVLFGVAAFGLLTSPSAADWALFALLSASNAGIFIGFAVLFASLAFWIDDAEGLAQQAMNILISFSTYPSSVFHGSIQLVLFSVVPAGFIGFVPVEVLRTHRVDWLLGHLALSAAFLSAGAWVFSRGLRRHSSGNLFVARL